MWGNPDTPNGFVGLPGSHFWDEVINEMKKKTKYRTWRLEGPKSPFVLLLLRWTYFAMIFGCRKCSQEFAAHRHTMGNSSTPRNSNVQSRSASSSSMIRPWGTWKRTLKWRFSNLKAMEKLCNYKCCSATITVCVLYIALFRSSLPTMHHSIKINKGYQRMVCDMSLVRPDFSVVSCHMAQDSSGNISAGELRSESAGNIWCNMMCHVCRYIFHHVPHFIMILRG